MKPDTLEIYDRKELLAIAEARLKWAEEYRKARSLCGQRRQELNILLASKISKYRGMKKNLGYDMAVLMLLEESTVAQEIYSEMTITEDKYKSLEPIMAALESKVMLYQSLMKWQATGDRY